jgi:hypothetical protein
VVTINDADVTPTSTSLGWHIKFVDVREIKIIANMGLQWTYIPIDSNLHED